jgi:hypothetical protein
MDPDTDCKWHTNLCIGEEKPKYGRKVSPVLGKTVPPKTTLFLTTLTFYLHSTLLLEPLYFYFCDRVQVNFPPPLPIKKWPCWCHFKGTVANFVEVGSFLCTINKACLSQILYFCIAMIRTMFSVLGPLKSSFRGLPSFASVAAI